MSHYFRGSSYFEEQQERSLLRKTTYVMPAEEPVSS